MSYVKTNWVKGKQVTPALLNHMEQGIYDAHQMQAEATIADCDALFDDFLEDDDE